MSRVDRATVMQQERRLRKETETSAALGLQAMYAQLQEDFERPRINKRLVALVNQAVANGADPQVVLALLDAGMSEADVLRYAHTVDRQEVDPSTTRGAYFLETLRVKLKQKTPADTAILKARFQWFTGHDPLSSREFRRDLWRAWISLLDRKDMSYETRWNESLRSAYIKQLTKTLGEPYKDLLQPLSLDSLRALEARDPRLIKAALSWGWSIDRIATLSDADLAVWLRFREVATEEQLQDPEIFAALKAAGPGDADDVLCAVLVDVLVARIGRSGAVVNEAQLRQGLKLLDRYQLTMLTWRDSDETRRLWNLGFSVRQLQSIFDDLVRSELAGADENFSAVISALIKCGFSPRDIYNFAARNDADIVVFYGVYRVTRAELTPDFVAVLTKKMAQGLDPGDAILCARYHQYTTEEELNDPLFLRQLRTGEQLYIDPADPRSAANARDAVAYARRDRLTRLINDGQATPLITSTALDDPALTPALIANLCKMDVASIRLLLQRGYSIVDIAKVNANRVDKLLALDPAFMEWLRSLGGSVREMSLLNDNELFILNGHYRALSSPTANLRVIRSDENFALHADGSFNLPIQLGGGLILYRSSYAQPPVQQVIITRHLNQAMFDKAATQQLTAPQSSDYRVAALRKQYLAALLGENTNTVDVPGLLINDEHGTVGQYAITLLLERYQNLSAADPAELNTKRAKLARLLQLRSALSNGYDLLPYIEIPNGGSGSDRAVGNPTRMSRRDIAELVDPQALDRELTALLSDPDIQTDYNAALESSLSALGDRRGAEAQRLYTAITSSSYFDLIKQLKSEGPVNSFAAQRMIQKDLTALQFLSPQLAQEARRHLNLGSRAIDLLTLLDDPSQLDFDSVSAALLDGTAVLIRAIRLGSGTLHQLGQTEEGIIDHLNTLTQDRVTGQAVAKVLFQALRTPSLSNSPLNPAVWNSADLEKLFSDAQLSDTEKVAARSFITRAKQLGVWGTLAGGAVAASFGYKLINGGAFSSDSSALERWSAAADIIWLLSWALPLGRGYANVTDKLITLVGNGPASDHVWRFLGFDRTLPQVWGKQSFLPVAVDFNRMWSQLDDDALKLIGSDTTDPLYKQAYEDLARAYANSNTPQALPSLPHRVGVSALKFLGNFCDVVGGVGDIVTGALGLKQAVASGDTLGVVTNSVGIGAGALFAAGGLINTATLFTNISTRVLAFSGPLFLVGVVLCVGTFLATLAVGNLVYDRQRHNATEDQTQWWRNLANDGVLQADWFDKLEYYRYAFFVYGNDNPEAEQMSYLQYQNAEWALFSSRLRVAREQSIPLQTSLNLLDPHGTHRFNPLTVYWQPMERYLNWGSWGM